MAPAGILFGPGRVAEVGGIAARLGTEVWIVSGGRSGAASGGVAAIERSAADVGLPCRQVASAAGEPTVRQVAAALAALPSPAGRSPVVVAVGGGSTIDLAKALAALVTNAADAVAFGSVDRLETAVLDRLEGVGRGLPIEVPPLPVVAVPTTAGTGAEATRNAVISCPRRRLKKSMRSPLMVPRAAVVDPLLSLSCDRGTTAASGLDCITQLIESFICRVRRPLPRALVLEALPRAVAALPRVLEDPHDLQARAAMSHAALLSGMALANAGLGMAHGVAAALGVECGTPHGQACAMLLPVALRANAEVARSDLATLERAVDPSASPVDAVAAAALVARVEALCRHAGTPRRLRETGLPRERLGWLAEHSGGSSMRGNPRSLEATELVQLLEAAW
jgi:alcohol dehydrogenase class IV